MTRKRTRTVLVTAATAVAACGAVTVMLTAAAPGAPSDGVERYTVPESPQDTQEFWTDERVGRVQPDEMPGVPER